MRRPSVSVAPRRTVTADTVRRSGAPQAAARPTTGGTVGSPGETPAMWGLSAAGQSARGGGPRAPGDASRARGRCCPGAPGSPRSEEHTSELQSRENLVCRLLLEKKKKKISDPIFLKSKKHKKQI